MKLLLFWTSLTVAVIAAEVDPGSDDLVKQVPGYPSPSPVKVYSNYLMVDDQGLRKLHYILVESPENPQNKPLTLWLNGGPGCTSKLGFLQEIGPYVLGINQAYPGPLAVNQYAWTGLSNILFIDSPAGVGSSLNNDPNYQYSDPNTADDNLKAVLYFFDKKFPSYRTKDFFIAGESYAGKYIPDLALRIQSYNQNSDTKIFLKGILIGNGVLDFSDGSLEKSIVQYYFDHNFLDPTLESYWTNSCLKDPNSAGCAYFHKRSDEILYKTNHYNVYYPCYDTNGPSQKNFIRELAKTSKFTPKFNFNSSLLGDCEYLDGVKNYFSFSDGFKSPFRSEVEDFDYCNWTILEKYQRTMSGAMLELPRILTETTIRVHLFNGDFDNVVPFTDTIKNLEKMAFRQAGKAKGWSYQEQNVGMKRTYTYGDKSLKFWTVKGAGHEVPQYKREVAYELFKSFLNNQE